MTLPCGLELARIMGAELRDAPGEIAIAGVAIDSRRVQPGDLFVALKGSQQDGHRYVPAALGAGADGLLKLQARRAVQERGHLAAFRHDLWEEVDHAVVGGVDAAGDIRRPKDRRLHQ